MPAIADTTGLKERLKRVHAMRGSYAAAADALGVNRQQMRQYVTQPGGYTRATREVLETALERFEDENAGEVERFERERPAGAAPKTQHNLPIPNIAQDVLRYMLDAVEARSIGGRADA